MTRRIGQWWRSHKGKNSVLGWLFMVPLRKEIHLANRNGARSQDRSYRRLRQDHRSALASAKARNDRGRSVRLNSTPSATSFLAVSARDARFESNLFSAPSRSAVDSNWANFSR